MANGNRNDDGTQVIIDDTLNNNGNTDNSNNSTNVNETELEVELEVDIDDSFNDNSVSDSANDNSDNSTYVDTEVEVEVEDSFNTETEIEDSFNDNSSRVDVEVEFEDSFNDNSKNDHSVRNQESFNVTSSFNTQTLNDHSITVGLRQYQTGFGDFNVDGALAGGKHGAAAGDLNLDNRSLQVDQSVNQWVETGGGMGSGNVAQVFGQNATIAFGDDSQAAGRDINIDNSSFDLRLGDVNVGNTDISTRINDAFKDQSTNYDLEYELEIEDSFNDYSQRTEVEIEIEDSFTSEVDAAFENSFEWENSGNIFSPGAATTGGETEFDF